MILATASCRLPIRHIFQQISRLALKVIANGLEGREADRALRDRVKDGLQSPVRKVRMIRGAPDDQVAPRAGQTALAQSTMLARKVGGAPSALMPTSWLGSALSRARLRQFLPLLMAFLPVRRTGLEQAGSQIAGQAAWGQWYPS